ncbi:hypothetical protein KKH03_05215 [Patescibacteria group bacterium]|nr:hypothetical protein [Patescibacteria group bacterium]
MAKKKMETIQKPIVIAGILVVMVFSLITVIVCWPFKGGPTPLPPQKIEVRGGTQVARVTIINPEDAAAAGITAPATIGESMDAPDAGGHIKFKIDHFQKLAVQPLKFNIFDDAGAELTPDYLGTINGAKVHFYLVHADLKLFDHIIPTYSGGVWNARADMPRSGTFYAYFAINPVKGDPAIYRSKLVVRDESPGDLSQADPTANLTAFFDSATARMEMKDFNTYRGFLYEIKKNGRPLPIVPVYDAVGSMLLIKHGDSGFFKTFKADGASEETIGKVSFSMGNLNAGRYTALLEVKSGKTVYSFAHTFDVGS